MGDCFTMHQHQRESESFFFFFFPSISFIISLSISFFFFPFPFPTFFSQKNTPKCPHHLNQSTSSPSNSIKIQKKRTQRFVFIPPIFSPLLLHSFPTQSPLLFFFLPPLFLGIAVGFFPSFHHSTPLALWSFYHRLPPSYHIALLTTYDNLSQKKEWLSLLFEGLDNKGEEEREGKWKKVGEWKKRVSILPILPSSMTISDYSCILLTKKFYEVSPPPRFLFSFSPFSFSHSPPLRLFHAHLSLFFNLIPSFSGKMMGEQTEKKEGLGT